MSQTDVFFDKFDTHDKMIHNYKKLSKKGLFEIIYFKEDLQHDGYTRGDPDSHLYDLSVLYKFNEYCFIDEWHYESWYNDTPDYTEEYQLCTSYNVDNETFDTCVEICKENSYRYHRVGYQIHNAIRKSDKSKVLKDYYQHISTDDANANKNRKHLDSYDEFM